MAATTGNAAWFGPNFLLFSSDKFLNLRNLTEECHRFLTLLSVRPGNAFAIAAHRLPMRACISKTTRSSASSHASLTTVGLDWLCQRSRHCFALRLDSLVAISPQLPGPYSLTSSPNRVFSSVLQALFSLFGLHSPAHRWRHWAGERVFMSREIAFHFLPPCLIIKLRSWEWHKKIK